MSETPLKEALTEVWSGRPVTIVASPPGGGKTTLLAHLVAELVERLGEPVTVATPTNRAGADIAMRLFALLGADDDGAPRVNVPGRNMVTFLPAEAVGVLSQASPSEAHACVRTVASLALVRQRVGSILVADEAWQSTFSDLAMAADPFEQLVMVGDPGQIGPVVSVRTRAWDSLDYAPHLSAPDVFSLRPDAKTVHISSTYRLGAQGVDVVAPLYDFPFDTRRGDRFMELGGVRIPEVSHVDMGSGDDPFDPAMLTATAERALALLGGTYVDAEGGRHRLDGPDIAVVVSRNAQRAFIDARLKDAGITVGTADSLQGGQWPGVVALDPLIGYDTATSHSMSVGRLCVMLSRQMAHVAWVHGSNWRKSLDAIDADPDEVSRAIAVREVMETVEGV